MDALKVFKSGKWENLSKTEIGIWFPVFVVYHSVRNLFKDNVTDLTASLAFASALAVVPLLSIVVSVLAMVGLFEGNDAVLTPFLQQVLPSAASAIGGYLTEFATTSAAGTVGISAVAFLGIGIFLFHRIERAFNTIWMSARKWSFRNFLIAFPSLILLGPIFVGVSFILTARIQLRLEQIGVDPSFIDITLPPTIAFIFFFLLNYFLPRPTVRWYSALVGGLFTTVAFEVAKYVFNFYVTEGIFEPYNKLYGTLGLLPMFMIWLYTTWLIVLLGVELSYCTQNLRTLMTVQAAEKRDPLRKQDRNYNPFIGLELFAPIAMTFKKGDGPMTERQLLEQTGYSAPIIRQVVDSLVEIGAVNSVLDESGEAKLIPSKQLDDILLLPMVENFFDFNAIANSGPLDDLYHGLHQLSLGTLSGKTALRLVSEIDEIEERRTSRHQPMKRLSQALEGRPAPAMIAQPDDSSFNHFPSKHDPEPVFEEPVFDGLSMAAESTSKPVNSPQEASTPEPVYQADELILPVHAVNSLLKDKTPAEVISAEGSSPKLQSDNQVEEEQLKIKPSTNEFASFESGEIPELAGLELEESSGLVEKNLSDLFSELGNEPSTPPPVPGKK